MLGRLRSPVAVAAAALTLSISACSGGGSDEASDSPSSSASAPTGATTEPYASNPSEAIADATASSAADRKPVLLDFGADWCPDCRVLDGLYEEPGVARILEDGFHLVRIDVGEFDKNLDVAAQYVDLQTSGIPALAVIAPSGEVAYASNGGEFSHARTMTASQLSSFLRQWAVGPVTAGGVKVSAAFDSPTSVRVTFAPVRRGFHLYSLTMPDGGVDGIGIPTRVGAGDGLRATGPPTASVASVPLHLPSLHVTLPVYPDGPVDVLLPVEHEQPTSSVVVTYGACSRELCLTPVRDLEVPVAPRA